MPQSQQSAPATSGADLARQALEEYKKRTWAIPGSNPRPSKPRAVKSRRGTGRDPVGLGSVLSRISTDPQWEASLHGGSIIDQWATLCPQYAGLVQPVAYDPDRGRLDLRPGTHAHAAQLRLLGGQLCKQINDKLGRDAVRSIRVLPVGQVDTAIPDPGSVSSSPAPAAIAPTRTRDSACAGYQHARTVLLEHKPAAPPRTPYLAAALARQDQAFATHREPEQAFTDGAAELERLTPADVDDAERIRQAAIARKHTGDQTVRRALDIA